MTNPVDKARPVREGGPVPAAPRRPPVVVADVPRSPTTFGSSEAMVLVGSVLAALTLTWLLFERITLLDGTTGFLVVAYLLFLVIYVLVQRDVSTGDDAIDRVLALISGSATVVVVGAIGWMLARVLVDGVAALDVHQDAVMSALATTLGHLLTALIIGAPLGIAVGLLMASARRPVDRAIGGLVEVAVGLPTILAGVLAWALVVVFAGRPPGGLAIVVALVVMVLPRIAVGTRSLVEGLPVALVDGARALGAAEWRVAMSVVLPTIRGDLAVTTMRTAARAIGEAAPLIAVTALASAPSGQAPAPGLPLRVFAEVLGGGPERIAAAWAGALVLLGVAGLLWVAATLLARRAARTQAVRRG